ncbi:hypothetical protein DV515_00016426 [Chloebia gouldiae]|uniref:Uncharacterized protein n=1 Tax=Chloebia gouldiae TaxID=44316 RepID=A0A3L8RTW8_CHLGU|nr:hypothetical protein DV515_00016426 [Chloebia gouldiae]
MVLPAGTRLCPGTPRPGGEEEMEPPPSRRLSPARQEEEEEEAGMGADPVTVSSRIKELLEQEVPRQKTI